MKGLFISEYKGIVHQDIGELNALSYIIFTVCMERIMTAGSSPGPRLVGAHDYREFLSSTHLV